MKKIVVASKNPVKISATLKGFKKMFPDETFEAEGVSVMSGVNDQPKTDSETFQGAFNRMENARKTIPIADFWVGIEGGTDEKSDNEMEASAWVVIQSKDNKLGKGKTGTFYLPKKVVTLIKQGKELGEAVDTVFGQTNCKQENGAVGVLTDDVTNRTEYYTNAVILALIPFKGKEKYELFIL